MTNVYFIKNNNIYSIKNLNVKQKIYWTVLIFICSKYKRNIFESFNMSIIKNINLSKEEYIHLYLDLNLHQREIAKLYNVSLPTLRRYLSKNNLLQINKKIIVSQEELIHMYIDLDMNLEQICKTLNITYSGLRKYIHKHKIILPKKRNHRYIKVNVTKEELYKLYITENKTLEEIGNILNISKRKTEYLLHENNLYKEIKINKISKEELYNLYIIQNKTRKEIANLYNTTKDYISIILSKYNIKKQEKAKQVLFINKNTLKKLYLEDLLTANEIANLYNVPTYVVENRLHNLNIHKTKEQIKETYAKNIKITKHKATSKEEDHIYDLLKTKYNNVERQYWSALYPFPCDFYIPELDLYIEYQGYWTHGKWRNKFYGKYDKNNPEHKKVFKTWLHKNTKAYKKALKTWIIRDPLKRETAKKNNLNWIEFFTIEEFKYWLTFGEIKKC